MTNPAAYLRPRLGDALSQTAGSVLTLAHQALVRRGPERTDAAGFPSAETTVLTDQEAGLRAPAHRVNSAVFDPPEHGQHQPVAAQDVATSLAKATSDALSPSALKPNPNSEITPSQQVLKLVTNSPVTQADTQTEQDDTRQDTATSSQLLLKMLRNGIARRTAAYAAQIQTDQTSMPMQIYPDGRAMVNLPNPFATRNAQLQGIGLQGGSPQEGQTPFSIVQPQQPAFETTATGQRSASSVGSKTIPSRNASAALETTNTSSGSLSALVDSLLRPNTQNAQNDAPLQAPAPNAEDDFDFQTRLRAALADILAQDMLRHGLRIPGVF
ncbi:hypothetical protein [Roseobacter sp. N2S]|uniref:hypothetical protein n=1 Tax=Roseobacter sp. N2S TaxID=2663844 RepID=UPI002859EEB2|nr:hypothetical protein [Roseobacter sp. N2S]MDR6264084.1 hypothetical protein [Roseobacter sp. N2S]